MDNLVANSQVRFPGANASGSLNPPRIPTGNAPVTVLNTTDAASFSFRPGSSVDLETVAAKVAELDQRIHALEAQVSTIQQDGGALAGNAPATNLPGANYGANYAANQPGANYGANNAPAANAFSNGAPAFAPPPPAAMPPVPPPPPAPAPPAPFAGNNVLNNSPLANNGVLTATVPAANNTAGQIADMRSQLSDLQQRIQQSIAQVNQALAQLPAVPQYRPAANTSPLGTLPLPAANNNGAAANNNGAAANAPANNAGTASTQPADPAKLQAGLLAVQNVLRYVKPGTYSPQDEATVNGAVRRVQQIGQEIAGGADPGQYAAELYALKTTIQDPAGVGNHPEATQAAQLIGQIEDQKQQLAKQLQPYQKLAAAGRLTPQQAAARDGINQAYKSLVEIEQALDNAKLTKLTATGKQTAQQAMQQLGNDVDLIASGKTDGKEMEQSIYRLGQLLRDPNTPPKPAAVEAGAGVVQQISDGEAKIKQRLGEIDDQIAGGAAPEKYSAERAELLDRLTTLEQLGGVVRGARADQPNAAAGREVAAGLQKAGAIAQALANGDSPEAHRADIFALKQTFQEPAGSRSNPTVQSAAAALQLIGRAEAKNLQQQDKIQAAVAGGADPRGYDQTSAKLNRQFEDLGTMRHILERIDYGGMSPDQQAAGAQLVDQMRDIAMKVAGGADYGQYRKQYEQLAAQVAGLRGIAKPNFTVTANAPAEPAANGDPISSLPLPQLPLPKPQPKPAANPAPQPAATQPSKPAPVAHGPYTVAKGDYLTKIAQEQLGDANRWKEIVALNQDKYPSLAQNPDLIQPGWVLQLPAGGGAAPAATKPANNPTPANAPAAGNNPAPKPHKTKHNGANPGVNGNAGLKADRNAVAWLKANLGPDGRISKDDIQRWMPEGRGKQDVLKNFDALMFGSIDPGRAAWSTLSKGDLDRMDEATKAGRTLDQLGQELTDNLKAERGVTDLSAYVQQLRNAPPTDAPTPPTPATRPQNANQADRDAAAWLSQHLGPNGRLSKADIAAGMPAGPAKDAVLKNFDALMFGFIDPGRDGWSNLFKGDVDRIRQATNDGMTIDQLGQQLTQQLQVERGVTDLPAYVAQLRASVGGDVPAPKPVTPAENPGTVNADASKTERMRHDLQVYLDDPNNKDQASMNSLVKDHPEFAAVGTPAQKAQIVATLLDGGTNSNDRSSILAVLKAADQKGELQATLQQLDTHRDAMKRLMTKMDDNNEGHEMIKLFLAHNLYNQPSVYNAMDDDASFALCKVLGFKHPMVGTNDQLRAVPEEAKYHMIKELTSGNVTWTELYMAQWINQHTDIPYRIPDYLTQNQNGFNN